MFGFLNFNKTSSGENEIAEIFPLSMPKIDFIHCDIMTTWTKILTDTVARCHGLPKQYDSIWWDSFVETQNSKGLITLLSEAMAHKRELFLVYSKETKILRIADQVEQTKIKDDYKKLGSSPVGVYVSFQQFKKTDILFLYSALEYCTIASLHKTLNIAKAVQVKISDIRSSINLSDASVAIEQGQNVATALRNGNDILIDVKDDITTAKPDVEAIEASMKFINGKRAYYLGLPLSYIDGEQTSGMNSTGEQDTRAVERGLKAYFESIIKPLISDLLGVELKFKSQDFRNINSALEALKTFQLIDIDVMPTKFKNQIIAQMFDIDTKELEKEIEKEVEESGNTLRTKEDRTQVITEEIKR